jgi:hypothetical protein
LSRNRRQEAVIAMRPDIFPGSIFPDCSLLDHTETVRTLSELQGRERHVQRDLDIAEYTDPDNNPMIPHTACSSPGS